MGGHYMEISHLPDGSLFIEGYNPSQGDGVISQVILRPGWTLGYDSGRVWAVMPAHMIKCPIKRVLREECLPGDLITWVDDLYSIYTDEDDFVSASLVIKRSYRIRDRASMNKEYRIDKIHVLKGTDPSLVAKFIKDFAKNQNFWFNPEDFGGRLSFRGGTIPSEILDNPYFVRVLFQNAEEACLDFQTGTVWISFSRSGETKTKAGVFDNLSFTPTHEWVGGRIGNPIYDGEVDKKIAELVMLGKKGRSCTTRDFFGENPKIEWED